MKPVLPLLASLVLASCAPAAFQGVDGRVVNVRTGQEGRVTFLGGFQDRAVSPGGPANVTVTVGDTVYSGRYTVLGGGGPRLGFGFGLRFGGAHNGYSDSLFSNSGLYGTYGPFSSEGQVTRPGNLIATAAGTGGTPGRTLTCTFQTDWTLHGIGTCQDSAGNNYSLQF